MSRIRANNITNQAGNGAPNAPHGLVVSGILTATGNVSIGGTVTYEDVTNVDSIGVITARTNIYLGDSIFHNGDANTRMRFPAADTISAETAGSERLRITGIGSVGIGTQNPANKLEVGGVISATDLFVTSGGDTTSNNISGKFSHGGINSKSLVIAADPNDVGANTRLQFDVDGAEKVRIEAAANGDGVIGINSSSPGVYAIDANSSLLNGGISYNCDNSPYGATNLKLTLSNRDSGSHYFRFGYSDNMNTRGMIQYYRPNLASSEDELRFWVGGAEKIRFTSTGGIGIATVGDGSTNGSIGVGSTGQVLTSQGPGYPSIWKGGATRILEQVSAPCSNESVMTSFGPRATEQVSAVQNLTSSYQDITGSTITYRPPTGTHTVIYKFVYHISNASADGISHHRFYVDGDEIIYARHTRRADDIQGRFVFEWPIRIDPTQATNLNHARLQSWDEDKILKMRAREYNADYQTKLHVTNNWDGSGTDMFSMPVITISALGS